VTGLARAVWALLAIGGLGAIVAHHVGYLRKRRPLTFGAFLQTAGWILITLVAITALGGGMRYPGTRMVDLVAALVGIFLIGIGSRK
jgi:hypothetical protein